MMVREPDVPAKGTGERERKPRREGEEQEMSSPHVRWLQPTGRQSIRTRLLALLLGLTIFSVLAAGYLGASSVQRIGTSAQGISAEALRVQAEEYLRNVAIGDARRLDLTLKSAQDDAVNVARYAAGLYERADVFAGGAYWRAEDHMLFGDDGQYMNDEEDVSDAFAPNFVEIDEALLEVLEWSAYLDFILPPIYEGDPNSVAIYLGTEEEVTRYYPKINLGMVVPPDFQVSGRPWYVSAAPESNPEHEVVWSTIYTDATGKGFMVTAAAPVYGGEGQFVGVVGIDVTLEDITTRVEATSLLGSGYAFLLDNTGRAIALPEQGYQDILGRSRDPEEFGVDLNEVATAFAPIIEQMVAGATGFDVVDAGGSELFVAYAPLESTGWSLANVVDEETVLQAVSTLEGELQASARSMTLYRILPFGGAILVAVAVIGLLLSRRLVDPIQRIAEAAQRIGAGQWDAPLPRTGRDEIGVLAQAFAAMTLHLRELMEGLEQRVADRTHDLERRSAELETAAHVAREAAGIRDVGQLLRETVRLISDRFGFYHAGIFLLDEAGEYAVLRAASSKGGQRMLARGHRLRVGEVGIVGNVAELGQPRVALDVGADAVFFDNPDLPETRSEMALPLRVREQVIGVVDVQSEEAAAFSDEDVAVLQTVADQVALAIENARLLTESSRTLRELETLYGRRVREAWRQREADRPAAYLYDRVEVAPASSAQAMDIDVLPRGRRPVVHRDEDGHRLAAPIRLRGETLGLIVLRREPELEPWSPEEVALVQEVSTQIALALENARLLEETQGRAEREQTLGQIATRLSRSLDVDTLLQAAVRELGQLLEMDEVSVHLGAPPGNGPDR
jgi:GAF domain-containing protein/HAMP domain-containing protein